MAWDGSEDIHASRSLQGSLSRQTDMADANTSTRVEMHHEKWGGCCTREVVVQCRSLFFVFPLSLSSAHFLSSLLLSSICFYKDYGK
jgi:hypothetical protein